MDLANTTFRALLPKDTNILPRLSLAPATSIFKTDQEYRYFDVFCTVARDMFNSDLLRQIVLQACHSDPSIRYAVIAVAALDYNTGAGTPGANRQYALQQYSTALKHLRDAASSSYQNIRSTLLANLMIIVFEACLGNDKLVLAQIQTSYALLTAWRDEYPDTTHHHALGLSSPAPDVIEEDLVRAFSRLEIQHLSNMDESALITRPDAVRYRSTEWCILRYGTALIENMPRSFRDLNEAHKYLEVMMKCAIIIKRFSYSLISMSKEVREDGLLWSSPTSSPPTSDKSPESTDHGITPSSSKLDNPDTPPADSLSPLEEISACLYVHLDSLVEWRRAYQVLEASHPSMASDPEAIKLLLHSKMTRIAFLAGLSFDQDIFDGLHSDFEDIVSLSATLLKVYQSRAAASSPLSFTFDLGVIVPLWLAGIKCHDPATRARVIALLHQYPRREGVWDGELAASMVEFIAELEVAHGTRMLGILWSFDWKNRSASLRCEIHESRFSDIIITERKTIFW